MEYTVCKEFTFDAAHQLPNHDGKCRNPHGHTYRVAVAVTGDVLMGGGPKSGMLIDFGDLKAIWKRRCEPKLDHRDLNQTLPVKDTTAERIATWIYEEFRNEITPSLELSVQVWETRDSWASVTP